MTESAGGAPRTALDVDDGSAGRHARGTASVDLPATQGLYRIPRAPKAAWTAAPSARRAWLGRGILLCILVVQAGLSMRLRNTAFEDEALYLYAGHLQLDHLLHGAPAHQEFASYFSGAPILYPVLGAAVDAHLGLAGARALGLVFMLGTTALLYSMSRRLFNERAALCAAAAFAITQSTLFLGAFATHDAPAILLLALAAWTAVRTARRGSLFAVALAAPTLSLAVAVKYASLLYLPTLAVLAVLAAYPYHGPRALVRGLLLPVLTGSLLAAALRLAGTRYLGAVETTTTNRAAGGADPIDLLFDSLRWGGPLLGVAVVGAVLYVRRDRMGELPGYAVGPRRGRLGRLCLGVSLCGTALLAPAYQMHLNTHVSLHKHIGYGLLFAAPMAGVGISRLVGAHFRRPELGIVVWVTLLTLGMAQSQDTYSVWPDSSRLISTLAPRVTTGGNYLVGANWVPQYYLRLQSQPYQWTSMYSISYTDRRGRHLVGEAGYRAAVEEGYFDVIVLDPTAGRALDRKLAEQLRRSPEYRLLATLPYRNTSGRAFYRTTYGYGAYQVWVSTSLQPT